MANQTNQIVNANIYVDGTNMLGRASEVDAPKVVAKMNEYKVLGQIGAYELPAGFDKMEMRIKWNAFYKDIATKFINPFKKIAIQIRYNLEEWQGGDRVSQVPVVIYATCQSKGFPLGNSKQMDNIELESNLSCTHVKMEINGVEALEVDFQNNIFKVEGVDMMAEYRANIGA